MHAAVVGAGPAGLVTALALARRGHRVTVVDRDPGPAADGTWPRRGVMQFSHPHAFRQQVTEVLQAELPAVWEQLLAAGAEPTRLPFPPAWVVGFASRRVTVERALRSAAVAEPGLELRTGHVEDVCTDRGRVTGLRVDGGLLEADLVVDASGRTGRLAPAAGGTAEVSDCGIAYVSRHYRLLPGAERGPVNAPTGMVVAYPRHQVYVFLQDDRTFSTLIVRAAGDAALAGLRSPAGYEAATAAIPCLADWTRPDRAVPLTGALPGGRLANRYRSQVDAAGRVLPGLVRVGDAVCTTNPMAGRGVATSLLQARRLVTLVDEHAPDWSAVTRALDAWCAREIRPWFDDHVHVDAERSRRWAGADVDPARPLPSDLVVAACEADPGLMGLVGPYLTMQAPPASLAAVQPWAQRRYAHGWRPPVPPGPSREELAELVARAAGPPAEVAAGR
jgi:2-polyprenyl-6-methoxyphenol hydroxylase-like FAD-dependent oxidoreductase